MIPITNAERARWQCYHVQTLAELVQLGGKYDLPPLTWTINGNGIVGRISTTSDPDPLQTFDHWCGIAKAEPEERRITHGGQRIEARAVAKDIGPHNRTDLVLELTHWKDAEEEVS